MPVSRSPVPPVAMPALPVRLTNERPSGPAMTVRCPLSTTCTRCDGGELARVLEPIGLHLLDADVEQPRHFARMRRDDHVDAVTAGQPLRIAGERVQRVRVEDERHAGALDDRLDERRGRRILPQARTDADDVGLQVEHAIDGAEIDRAGRGLLERLGHVLRHHLGDRRRRTSAASRS